MRFASGGRRLEKLAGANATRRESAPRRWRTVSAGPDPWSGRGVEDQSWLRERKPALAREFHPVHHPSYVDFYEEVLATTKDPVEIEQRFERSYAEDDWYRHLYRTSYAYHGVHPFYMWYWGAHALQHLGDVIFVGGDPQACRRLGFRRADTMRDALEMAEQVVGRDPSLTHFHCPPLFYAQVEA